MIDLDTYRQLVTDAARGEVPTPEGLASAGVRSWQRAGILGDLEVISAIAEVGGRRVARRYANVLLERAEEAREAASAVDEVLNSGVASVARGRVDPGNLHTHPASVVTTGVAGGRPVPTRDQLDELGFPTDIATATIQAAEVVAAARDGVDAKTARRIANNLGPRVAYQHPWPEPEDDWSDLARDVSRHQGASASDFDAADAADQIGS